MLPSPPGIRITLACGAFGLISTAREPPILTVSSAIAGAHARPASIAAAPKQSIHPYLLISCFPCVDGFSACSLEVRRGGPIPAELDGRHLVAWRFDRRQRS